MPNHPETTIESDWQRTQTRIENIPQPAAIFVDRPGMFSNHLPNIYFQVEPSAIIDQEKYLLENYQKQHTIFSFNQKVIESCPNVKQQIQGTTWIPESQYCNIDLSKKQYKISTLAGSKKFPNARGHTFRQVIHHNQKNFQQYPITFFRSSKQQPHIPDQGGNPFIGDSKIPLFEEQQFSIVIENSKQQNYFTEKIMDCLLTKTIPIYYGCPNISDQFDTTGWILLESDSIGELFSKLEVLSENYQSQQSSVIESNQKEAQKYIDFTTNINHAK